MNNYYKKSTLSSTEKKPSKILKVLTSPLTYSTLMLLLTGMIYNDEMNKETPKDEYLIQLEKIHSNIENVYGLSKFEMVGFQGLEANNKYYLGMLGSATKSPNAKAVYVEVIYQIDNNLYSIITNKEKTSYQNMLYVLTVMSEITKQKAISFEERLPDKMDFVQISTNDFQITGITKPLLNEQTQTVSFQISAITKQELLDDDSHVATIKTFEVSAPLTAELAKNPDLIFKKYMTEETNFNLVGQEEWKVQNYDYVKLDSKQYTNEHSF